MDLHALEYYRPYSDDYPHAHFHAVIPLHEKPDFDWKWVQEIAPQLHRGWYELARLEIRDRIDFMRDFWMAKFVDSPKFCLFVEEFFKTVDDLGIFLTQRTYDDPFEPQCVYSLSGNSGFYHGNPPITEEEKTALQNHFPDFILPEDYLRFLQIHNGFYKQTDSGVFKSTCMPEKQMTFKRLLEEGEPVRTSKGTLVNPKSLIPFYQSFNMPFFQCFWGEWYPDQEMGNVYFSGSTNTITDSTQLGVGAETMSFETFTDWLIFYLEKIE